MTSYGLDDREVESSIVERSIRISISLELRPTMRQTTPAVQLIPGVFYESKEAEA